MKKIKNQIRFQLGLFFKSYQLSNTFRIFLLTYTKITSRFFLGNDINAYVRRSLISPYFIPFWSDVDMTMELKDTDKAGLLLSMKKMNNFLRFNFFVKDIELIDDAIAEVWLNHSGYKNWNKGSWLAANHFGMLADFNISGISNEEAYYNLTWEHRFLYEQLNLKIKALNSDQFNQIDLVNAYKNIADIENLSNFLIYKKIISRQDTLKKYEFYPSIFKTNLSIESKNKHLDFITAKFSEVTNIFSQTIVDNIGHLYELKTEFFNITPGKLDEYIHFFGQKTCFVESFSKEYFQESLKKYPDAILMTPGLFRAYKLFGIQEITPTLEIMRTPQFSFIKNYLITRLIQDYLQAIFENKGDVVLFYCRKNLDLFFYSRLRPEEALSYSKTVNETDLEHYIRARDKLVKL